MQFEENLINQTWESAKKYNFELDFGLFDPSLGLQKIFHGFYLY